MFDAILKHAAVPRIPALPLATAGTLGAFGLLLIQGHVHPMVVYLLQLYLAF